MPKQTADDLPETIAAQGGVLVPKQYLPWVIILMLGSGFGGPALNNFFARNVSQDAQTISEQGKLMVSMLERFDKKLEQIGDHMDELDSRMTRLERADRASKSKERDTP